MPAPTESTHPIAGEIAERIWRYLHEDRRRDPAAVRFWTRRSTDSRRAICIVVGYSGPETKEVYREAMNLLHDRIEKRTGTRFRWHDELPMTDPDPSSTDGAVLHGYQPCELCAESYAVLTVGRLAPLEVCSSPGCVKDAVDMCADDGATANEFGPAVVDPGRGSVPSSAAVVDGRAPEEVRA